MLYFIAFLARHYAQGKRDHAQTAGGDKERREGDNGLDDITVGQSARIATAFAHGIGIHGIAVTVEGDQIGKRNNKNKGANQINPGLRLAAPVGVEHIDAYVAVCAHCVGNTKQEDNRIQVPFHLLHANGHFVEGIARNHVVKHVGGHQQHRHTGDPAAERG